MSKAAMLIHALTNFVLITYLFIAFVHDWDWSEKNVSTTILIFEKNDSNQIQHLIKPEIMSDAYIIQTKLQT